MLALFIEKLKWITGKRENVIGYLCLLIDLTAFFSIFFILYETYKQDIERSKILSRDPDEDSELYYRDKEIALKKEKKRVLSFFWVIGLIIFPSLVMRINECRTILAELKNPANRGCVSADTTTPFENVSSSSPSNPGEQ